MTDLTAAYITALTGSPETICDFRCIHDREKGVPAIPLRGSLSSVRDALLSYNQQGYGIFMCINAMNGQGNTLEHVEHIRTHVVDMDDLFTSQAAYQRAVSSQPLPHLAVQSSPNKFHVYWLVEPYVGNDFYTTQQRKLAQLYDGDKQIIDACRVMRVPGFYHLKAEPFLVSSWGLSPEPRIQAGALQHYLQHVNVFEHQSSRHELGTPEMQAPSFEWLCFALGLINPNELDREEWLSVSAAFKQAGWSHVSDNVLRDTWVKWCAQYQRNDSAENEKLWNSIRDTEVGWVTFKRKTVVQAYIDFGNTNPPVSRPAPQQTQKTTPQAAQEHDPYGAILDAQQCAEYFKHCYLIERLGQIYTPEGRFMNSTEFNAKYGGKIFVTTDQGKTTDEPWKAALRSTCWTVPKMDHIRFLPMRQTYEVVLDDMGRKGLNTFIPARVKMQQGDVSLWLDHVARILPRAEDQKIWFDYLAHCVKYPGYKIPWAPMIQSAEGVGKSVFIEVIQHALGAMYTYRPKAQELVSSGSKFNAWMRSKLMIIVDEIKIDERRELIEILKPMISDVQIEIQAKGVDQEIEDNPANWVFFSNYKDAIPVNKNGRRFAIFYSSLQSKNDILKAGMNEDYFNRLWSWLRDGGGFEAVAYWLHNYPIERGSIPHRAPETTSYIEALKISRTPLEIVIDDSVADALPGFRGGYVSTLALTNRMKATGHKIPPPNAIQSILETKGYVELGRPSQAYAQESMNGRAVLYGLTSGMSVEDFGRVQGYE